MPIITTSATRAPVSYDSALKLAIASGWEVVCEGPSGVQLKKPNKMRFLDAACIIAGVFVGTMNVLIGGFMIAIGLVDYTILTKPKLAFIFRKTPEWPQ